MNVCHTKAFCLYLTLVQSKDYFHLLQTRNIFTFTYYKDVFRILHSYILT